MLIDDKENDGEEEDETKENKSKLKRTKGKRENNNEKQKKSSKKKRHEIESREGIEDDGVNYENELKKRKEMERTFWKHYELSNEDHAN